jgi:hypothetical protein
MNTILLIYLGISFAHLSFQSEGYQALGDLTKILLMPILIVYVMQQGSYPLIVAALLFATIGDALLTKGHQGTLFLWGMSSFAICHMFYSIHVLSLGVDWVLTAIAFAGLLIPYGLLYRLIGKQKGSAKYLAYSALLCILASLLTGLASLLCIIGIFLFMLSDIMIGLDSLEMKHVSGISEMGSYILAQLFLVLGFTAL